MGQVLLKAVEQQTSSRYFSKMTQPKTTLLSLGLATLVGCSAGATPNGIEGYWLSSAASYAVEAEVMEIEEDRLFRHGRYFDYDLRGDTLTIYERYDNKLICNVAALTTEHLDLDCDRTFYSSEYYRITAQEAEDWRQGVNRDAIIKERLLGSL